MATLKQSWAVNMSGWEPSTEGGNQPQHDPPTRAPYGKSPYMISSMPLMASTGDALVRQFYGDGKTPTYRILPAKRGAGA